MGGTVTVACAAGTLTLDLTGSDGTYTLTVTVTDAGGNTSVATTRTYLLDTTAPDAPGVTGPTGPSNVRGARRSSNPQKKASASITPNGT